MSEGKVDPVLLRQAEELFGISLDQRQITELNAYLTLLRKWSRSINLTTIEKQSEVLQFHFFEAFWVAREFIERGCRLVDVGSGAGFPGMAMRLYRPDLHLTLVEPNYKKTIFLKKVAHTLGYEVCVLQCKAEDLPDWTAVQLVTVRALKLSRTLLQLLRQSGCRALFLHGADESFDPLGPPVEKRPIPGSKNRMVSLFDFR